MTIQEEKDEICKVPPSLIPILFKVCTPIRSHVLTENLLPCRIRCSSLKLVVRKKSKVYLGSSVIRLIKYSLPPCRFLWEHLVTAPGKNRRRLNSREASQEQGARTRLGHNAAAAPGGRRSNLEGGSSLWILNHSSD